jgi:hypothetical protein
LGDCLLWAVFSVTEVAQIFGVTGYVLILTSNVLGCILGDFFTNSAGHPEQNPHFLRDQGCSVAIQV